MMSSMSTMRGGQALREYLDDLTLRGLSVNYVNKVREFLEGYVDWASNVSIESAKLYLLRYSSRKPNTRARYTTNLRGFLNYLGIPFDIRVKVPRLLPTMVSDSDIAQMRACIESKRTHKATSYRDLVLLDTATLTGLRRSELANLRVRDINFAAPRLMVVGGKGNKDRIVPLVPSLSQDLQQLCTDKRPNETVFGLTSRSVGMKFYIWAKKAGVDLHTHSFRHHFATRLVDRGANIRAVQELLGHSSLTTTQVYLSVTGRHLEEAIKLL